MVSNIFLSMNGMLKKARSPELIVLFSMIICYTVILSWASCIRFWSYYALNDLAIFEQSLWMTLKGHFFYSSLLTMSQFGLHNSPILFILLPFYAVFQNTETLLVIQSFVYGAGAIPVYLIAKDKLGGRMGLFFSGLYLLYPPLHGANLADFHEIAFAPLILGMCLYFLMQGKFRNYIIFSILALTIKEDISLIIITMTIWGLWYHKNTIKKDRIILFATIIISALWLIVSLFVIIPAFNTSSHYLFLNQYSNPIKSIVNYGPQKLTYLIELLFPLGFTSIFSPGILIAGITGFLAIFISPSEFYSDIYHHYSAYLIPFIFFSSVVSLNYIFSKITSDKIKFKNIIISVILCCSISSFILYGPLLHPPYPPVYVTDDDKTLDLIISLIPENAIVSTQANLLSHLSKRYIVTNIFLKDADVILLYEKSVPEYYQLLKSIKVNETVNQEISTGFMRIYNENGISLFVRKSDTLISGLKSFSKS